MHTHMHALDSWHELAYERRESSCGTPVDNFKLDVMVNKLVPERGLEAELYILAPVGNRRQLQKVAHLI